MVKESSKCIQQNWSYKCFNILNLLKFFFQNFLTGWKCAPLLAAPFGGCRGWEFLSPPLDTKKYLQIYEDLDGGFVGDNQVLMLFFIIYLVFLHIFRNPLNIFKKNPFKSLKNNQKFSWSASQFDGKFLTWMQGFDKILMIFLVIFFFLQLLFSEKYDFCASPNTKSWIRHW